ncbi:MAG: hypothetical protein LBJ11_00055 [Oscillospiraceae bacterium]|jgi:hypothetical protein|nr:hypothetical protein [Oscillospiraceae bacterium]
MTRDEQVLRPLAYAYAEAAREPRNWERRQLHMASNDLHMIRPVVLLDEIPWDQLNIDGSLVCRCDDPDLRGVEQWMRRQLFQYRHFPADMFLREYVGVGKVVHSTGIGIGVKETTRTSGHATQIISHEFEDQLEEEEALERIHPPVLTYDETETNRRWTKIGGAVGDILPVRKTGTGLLYIASWDDIARYRGVTNILLDLVDRPEYSHRIIEKITQCREAELDQLESLGLLDRDPPSLHCTPALTRDLPAGDGETVTRAQIWGRGMAQIFGSVSRTMHEAFDITYMPRTVGQCGLVYYGCCEPLDRKIDLVEKIPRLRKIGVTPWADVDRAAEIIGGRYVVSNKPNPAAVAVPRLDEDGLRRELGRTLAACKRSGTRGLDIVLKDVSTCGGNPENLFRWEKIAMELAESW